jgi:predicted nucleic acid-binding protein
MRFWDSSALIPLVVTEPQTRRVELCSALARRRRAEPRATRNLTAARREVFSAWEQWTEVTAAEVVRRHAERLIEAHPLRAADAFQLGAAFVAAEELPAGLTLVTLDRQQAQAAEREGFSVLGPD